MYTPESLTARLFEKLTPLPQVSGFGKMVWENLAIGCSAPQFKLVARHLDAGARKINAGAHKGIIGDFFWQVDLKVTQVRIWASTFLYTPPQQKKKKKKKKKKSYRCMIYVLVQLILH